MIPHEVVLAELAERRAARHASSLGSLAWLDRDPVVRSKGVSGFRYRVVSFVDDDILRIVAVAHAKRRPGYWRERVTST